MTTSKFLFVDLAGSERIKKTQSEFMKAAEAKNINMSLTTLGRCIQALKVSKGKDAFIPFRESSLTMLLKNSLTGNCRTCLIVTIAEEPDMIPESASSLRFGVSCGRLKTKVSAADTVNVEDTSKRLMDEYVTIMG